MDRRTRGANRRMTRRLVSPDRKVFLVAEEEDLKAVGKLYNLTPKKLGNVRQLLGWTTVGNGRGDRNDRRERKEGENFMLFENVAWLKHDHGTEYVPLVGKLVHMFDSVVTPRSDMHIGSKESLGNLLRGAKMQIGGWRKVPPPQQVFPLRHGSSLVGLQACAALTLTLAATRVCLRAWSSTSAIASASRVATAPWGELCMVL